MADFFEKNFSDVPYFREEQLPKLRTLLESHDGQSFFCDAAWNLSEPANRIIALQYYVQNRTNKTSKSKSLKVTGHQYFPGNLIVDGNLRITSSGSLVVLGSLTVSGKIYLESDYPGLYVGDSIEGHSLFASEAEVISLQNATFKHAFALQYNHTVVIIPKVDTPISLIDDASPNAEIRAEATFDSCIAFIQTHIDPRFDWDAFDDEERMFEECNEMIYRHFSA